MGRVRSRSGLWLSMLLLASGAVLGSQVAADSREVAGNPEAGLSDAQREALHQAAHDRNDAFLQRFVASRQDPHSLPVVQVETYAVPPATLAQALAAASVVIEGRVSAVDFASNPSGGMPFATATVAVVRTLRGAAAPATVVVRQSGGPVAQGDGGGLAQFDVDPLLLPGDHDFLLLTAMGTTGQFRTVPGSGVMNIHVDDTVSVDGGSPSAPAVNGRTADEVASALAAK